MTKAPKQKGQPAGLSFLFGRFAGADQNFIGTDTDVASHSSTRAVSVGRIVNFSTALAAFLAAAFTSSTFFSLFCSYSNAPFWFSWLLRMMVHSVSDGMVKRV